MTITLRNYQREAIEAVLADWEAGLKDVLLTMATGLGKTAVFLSLLDRVLTDGKRGLVLAHRKELIDQPLARLYAYYPHWQGRAGIVMAEIDEPGKQLIVATVQSLAASPKRLERILSHGPIDYLVTDECLVAGTLVDGRPIETIEPGDQVTAYHEKTRRMTSGRVTRLFKRRAPGQLVRIITGGRQIVCTFNHPILGKHGWIPAGEINENDEIYVGGNPANLCAMPAGVSADSKPVVQPPSRQTGVLFGGMQAKAIIADNGEDKPEVRQSAHESQQPNEQARFAGEDAFDDQGDVEGRFPGRAVGQWASDRATEDVGRGAALGRGSGDTDRAQRAGRIGLSAGVQGGHRQLEIKDRYRGGREESQSESAEGRGCEEGCFAALARVDRVEVLKRGSDGEFERVCPDGYVYNLEIEGFHTYTANGIVVHNCHHVTDKNTYSDVLSALREANPRMRHLGVTATPVRADGDGLGGVFQKESYHFGIVEGIRQGHLAPVRWLAIQTAISVAEVKTVAGDFQKKGLANVFETANCFDLVVESHKKYADGRQAAAFTVSVEGAYRLAEKFRAAGYAAEAADGTTEKRTRARILRDFQEGRLQILCNVGLYTEGLDVPQISCIHQVRPTRSDGLYTQIIGRALRTYPGKEDALILDYAPAETRNIAMAGDVLGVPLRRESYLQDVEAGEAAGGFTFDGKWKWMEGNPAEIISRQLDYLSLSPWSWWRQDGWLSLGLGEASDNIERVLLISPPDDDGELTLYGIGRKITRVGERRETGQWNGRELGRGSFVELSDLADRVCERYGNPALAAKQKAWRKDAPTDKQIAYARRLKGAWKPGYTKGQLAQAITHAQALRTVKELSYVPA